MICQIISSCCIFLSNKWTSSVYLLKYVVRTRENDNQIEMAKFLAIFIPPIKNKKMQEFFVVCPHCDVYNVISVEWIEISRWLQILGKGLCDVNNRGYNPNSKRKRGKLKELLQLTVDIYLSWMRFRRLHWSRYIRLLCLWHDCSPTDCCNLSSSCQYFWMIGLGMWSHLFRTSKSEASTSSSRRWRRSGMVRNGGLLWWYEIYGWTIVWSSPLLRVFFGICCCIRLLLLYISYS